MSEKVSIESQKDLSNLSQYSSYRDDEIDLKELIVALWQGKWIILICTFLITTFAVVYALTEEQKWTSEAVITAPQPSDFEAYQKMVNGFQPLFDIYQQDGSILVSKKLDSLMKPENIFQIFVQQYQSKSSKLSYLSQNDSFKQDELLLQKELSGDEYKKAKQKLYVVWADKLSLSTQKNTPGFYILRGESDTDQGSFELLSGYIDYVTEKSRRVVITNLTSIVQAKQGELQQEFALLQDQAKDRLEAELIQSKYALQIAQAAKIPAPVENLGVSDMFSINIGANALEAKVKVLEGLNQLSVLDPRLNQVNAKLKMAERLKISEDASFDTFRFVESPERPLSRTSPNRRLIAVLGVLLGGMLGCLIVLVRFAFREK